MKKEIVIGHLERYCKPTASLLVVLSFLALCEAVGWEPTFVITLRLWLQSASDILTVFNLLVIAYLIYAKKDTSKKPVHHHKRLNIGICSGNIILVNELYKDSKLVELRDDIPKLIAGIWTAVSSFIEGRSFGGLLVLAAIVAAIVTIVFASRKKSAIYVSPDQQTVQPQTERPQTEQRQIENPQTAPAGGTPVVTGSSILFAFLYVFFLLLVFITFWYIVRHFDLITQIPKSIDFVALLQLAITGLAVLIAVPVILMLAVRYMVVFFTNLPAYFSSTTPRMENMIKAALSCTVALLLFFISKYGKFHLEDFINFDSNKLLIILPPFVVLVYVFVGYIIVELINGVLSGEKPKFIANLKKAADDFGNYLSEYCGTIFNLLGKIIKILPEFLDCLYILLFAEEENGNMPSPKSKPKDRNSQNTPENDLNRKGGSVK